MINSQQFHNTDSMASFINVYADKWLWKIWIKKTTRKKWLVIVAPHIA